MRVRVDLNDGYYFMTADDVVEYDTTEIPDDIWKAYREHVMACGKWQTYMRKLDNHMLESRNGRRDVA